jgi:hypothetical protein
VLAVPRLGERDSVHEAESILAQKVDEIVGRRPVEALPHAGRVTLFGAPHRVDDQLARRREHARDLGEHRGDVVRVVQGVRVYEVDAVVGELHVLEVAVQHLLALGRGTKVDPHREAPRRPEGAYFPAEARTETQRRAARRHSVVS